MTERLDTAIESIDVTGYEVCEISTDATGDDWGCIEVAYSLEVDEEDHDALLVYGYIVRNEKIKIVSLKKDDAFGNEPVYLYYDGDLRKAILKELEELYDCESFVYLESLVRDARSI